MPERGKEIREIPNEELDVQEFLSCHTFSNILLSIPPVPVTTRLSCLRGIAERSAIFLDENARFAPRVISREASRRAESCSGSFA